MAEYTLGKTYRNSEIIAHQGEVGDCMFVIQEGPVDVVVTNDGVSTVLRTAEVARLKPLESSFKDGPDDHHIDHP